MGTTTSVLLLIGVAVLTFGYSISGFVDSAKMDLKVGLGGSRFPLAASVYFYDLASGAFVASEYRQVNSMIPKGAKVLAAVDYPALLSFTKYQFATLDLVGAVCPPGMPYGKGPRAEVAYLRRLGYGYVVAEAPSDPGLYNIPSWSAAYRSRIYAYRLWAPYFIHWQRTVSILEQSHEFSVRHAGSLVLIRIG